MVQKWRSYELNRKKTIFGNFESVLAKIYFEPNTIISMQQRYLFLDKKDCKIQILNQNWKKNSQKVITFEQKKEWIKNLTGFLDKAHFH